ncbi:hypothetical protein RFI_28691 [Reticulomyxa filosa]|uniref:Uncharacterized protein n=1 Tax=Reticulomyxa filosa TaxID=46433 RepID=X6M4Y0_RETFI|nr:hypothetical protein RFI_28691 [Reticulomyxa filosa]|eukprot:ETO08696.1 hypothetical protein RFI_28691 [Reticulomyxa filosa]
MTMAMTMITKEKIPELEIGVGCDDTCPSESLNLNQNPSVLLQEYPNERYPNLWHLLQWDEQSISQEKCNKMRKENLGDLQFWKQLAAQVTLPLGKMFTLFSYINFEWFRKLFNQCTISFFVISNPQTKIKIMKSNRASWTDQEDTLIIKCFQKFMTNNTNLNIFNDSNETTFVDYAFHELKDKIFHTKQSIRHRWSKIKPMAHQSWQKKIGKLATPEHMITPLLASETMANKEEMEMVMDSVEHLCMDNLCFSNALNIHHMNMLNDDDKYNATLCYDLWKHNNQQNFLSKLQVEIIASRYAIQETRKTIKRKFQQIRPLIPLSQLMDSLELGYNSMIYDYIWNESSSNKMYQSKSTTTTNASEQSFIVDNMLGYKQLVISKYQNYDNKDVLLCIEHLLRDGWTDTQEQNKVNEKASNDASMSLFFQETADDIYWNAWKETWKEIKTEKNKTCIEKKTSTISEYYKQINISVCNWIISLTLKNPWGIEWLDAYHKYIHAPESLHLSKRAFRQHLWYLINTDQIIFVEIFNKCVIIPRTEANNAMICPFTATIKYKGNKMNFNIPNICNRKDLDGCFMTSPFLRISLVEHQNNSQGNNTDTKNDNENTLQSFDSIFTLDENLIKKMRKAVKCKIYETPGISLLQLYRYFKVVVTPMQMLHFICVMYYDGIIQLKTIHVPIEFRSGLGCRKCIVHDKCWIDFYFVPTERMFF